MKLSEKGRFAPPPIVPGPAQEVVTAVGSWAMVHGRTHWRLGDERVVDGADFYFGSTPDSEEIGHVHLDGEVHVMLPRGVVDELVAAGLGKPFPWSREIVAFRVTGVAHVPHALWLFQLSYDRRKGVGAGVLIARVRERRPSDVTSAAIGL